MNNYGWSGGVRDVGGSPTHAPATKIASLEAQATAQKKRRKKNTTAKLGVWLASDLRWFLRFIEENGLPAEVPRGRSVLQRENQKGLKYEGYIPPVR